MDGYKEGIEYFAKRENKDFPTVVVCYNDLVALDLLFALQELNREVTDDVSIIGE